MNLWSWIVLGCLTLLILMLIVYALGHRYSRRRARAQPPSEGSKAIHAAIFAIMGLLIAFSYAKAYSRLDERRALTVQEVNAIGTAYSRIDLLSQASQIELRKNFKQYIALRAHYYNSLRNLHDMEVENRNTAALEREIWRQAIENTQGAENASARLLLIPALNAMEDIVLERSIIVQSHPPLVVFLLLSIIAILCAGITGYSSGHLDKKSFNLYNITFAIIVSFTFYIILDIEHPIEGLVTLNKANEAFKSLLVN